MMKRLPALLLAAALLCLPALGQGMRMTPWEATLVIGIHQLRGLKHAKRVKQTMKLAYAIRQLPAGREKLVLANNLADLSTEADLGQATVQQVATTLAQALEQFPLRMMPAGPAPPYLELADLVRYEHVTVQLHAPGYQAALAQLAAADTARAQANFTLTDMQGRRWTLDELKGKVVLVNFWATWCPPCRAEMPDLESLYQQYKGQGLVILGISDETPAKVSKFLKKNAVTYPILLDPGDQVEKQFRLLGIPNSYLYDRQGHMVGQAMDARSHAQFLTLLASAGLK